MYPSIFAYPVLKAFRHNFPKVIPESNNREVVPFPIERTDLNTALPSRHHTFYAVNLDSSLVCRVKHEEDGEKSTVSFLFSDSSIYSFKAPFPENLTEELHGVEPYVHFEDGFIIFRDFCGSVVKVSAQKIKLLKFGGREDDNYHTIGILFDGFKGWEYYKISSEVLTSMTARFGQFV